METYEGRKRPFRGQKTSVRRSSLNPTRECVKPSGLFLKMKRLADNDLMLHVMKDPKK